MFCKQFYDDLGRAETITDPNNQANWYGYDGHGNRTSLIYPDGKVVNYAYDGLHRLQSVTYWQTRQAGYQCFRASKAGDAAQRVDQQLRM